MKYLFALMVFLCSFSSWALSGRSVWKQSSLEDKAKLIENYRDFFQELSTQEADSYSEWMVRKTSFFSYFISDAWASGNMDCIYAGWPSKRVSGLCSSPARQNPDYQNGTCASNEMQCQPMFFGKGLCVPTSTRSQRNLAFSNCYKKLKASGKSNQDIIKEIQSEGKEAELLELLDFADKTCTSGKQANTGMCVRLKSTVAELRDVAPSVPTQVSETEEEQKEAEELRSAVEIAAQGLEEVETLDQTVDCPPEAEVEQKIAETHTASTIRPVEEIMAEQRGIASSGSTYTPQQALDDIASGNLTFLGRALFPGSDQNRTCVFKSEKAYVLYYNCMASRKEAPATDIEIISFDGGVARFYVENYKDTGRLSQMDRSRYDGSWTVSYTPSSPPGNLNVAQLISYKENLLIPKDGACWVGNTGKAQDMSTQAKCYGNAQSKLGDWGPQAESFWKTPGPTWSKANQTLRRLVETVPF